MPRRFSIELDNSFIDICLNLIDTRRKDTFDELILHDDAKKVHAHALRFDNTRDSIAGFWRRIVDTLFSTDMESAIKSALAVLDENMDQFRSAMNDVAEYLPKDIEIDCKLYTMVGYDIGIVSEGSAFVNIAHPFFPENPCELIYMSMHETHHVGYVHYNPIFSFSDLKKLSELRDAVRYLTHLEGIAVYAPLRRRVETRCIAHEDYLALMDVEITEKRTMQYFDLVKELEETADRKITEEDFEILEPMSAKGKRLWYVTGAHMAKIIDENLGRAALLETIRQGPDRFFDLYNSVS
ncbi:MAG: hypothetical protein P1Q69_12795 [Candidatus Thorarchaeota archaeon]|nr:hypothetical protein [Candidatus Thorarchaeota archaeon]